MLLLSAPHLLTVADPTPRSDHGVLVSNGEITAIGKRDDLKRRYPDADERHYPHHVIMPGLVNTHGHLAMSLLRGLGESQPLEEWLKTTIWPLEAKSVSAEFVGAGTELAIAEMISTGTTTASDMYFFPDAAARVAAASGFRAQIAAPLIDFPNIYTDGFDHALDKATELREHWAGHPLVQTALGPHAVNTVSETSLAAITEMDGEPVQIHAHETEAEVAAVRAQYDGRSPIDVMADAGLLSDRLQLVHMTAINRNDIERVAAAGATISHCPHSNMKLASGTCPVAELDAAGIAVGFGTDGAASNNSLDLFETTRLAALLAKHTTADAATLNASRALEMATIDGARVLGLDRTIGTLEVGKRADVAVVDVSSVSMQPLNDLTALLVHTGAGKEVRATYIDGVLVYDGGTFPTLDIQRTLANAREWQTRLAAIER